MLNRITSAAGGTRPLAASTGHVPDAETKSSGVSASPADGAEIQAPFAFLSNTNGRASVRLSPSDFSDIFTASGFISPINRFGVVAGLYAKATLLSASSLRLSA